MNYKTIEHLKLILSSVQFKPSKQGGFINNEIEICKFDFNCETIDQQKTVIKNILSWLHCDHEGKVINKIISDIAKN
jgi:hypothetical protein